jgi:ribosomal subunit interface protein
MSVKGQQLLGEGAMTLRVSGKHLDIGDSLRAYVSIRLDGIIAKYSVEPASGHVTVEREGSGFRTDCIVHLDSGITLQVEAEAADAYASFNKAADRIENRLRRLKRRSRDRISASTQRVNLGAVPVMLKVDTAEDAGRDARDGDMGLIEAAANYESSVV